MRKFAAVLIFSLSLSGCASHYFLDGKKYENEDSFQAAVEERRSSAINQVQPLPSPLTKKRLVVAIPNEQAHYTTFLQRHQVAQGKEAMGLALDQYRNLAKGGFILSKVFFDAVQKRGIYSAVTVNTTQSAVNSLEPSNEYDVMYFTEPAIGSGQYFYSSSKHGKQVFAYDNSGTGTTAKVNAFIDAVQALAIRE
jgi:hypothetical protein